MEEDFEYVLQLEKLESTDPNRLIIAGMASSGDLDHDGERIDIDSLRGQFDKYMKNPVIRFMHGKDGRNPDAIGKVIPEYTDTKGKVWKTEFRNNGPFIIAEISNADDVKSIRTKIIEKNLRGLSIGGRAKRTKVYDPNLDKDVNNITVLRWNETSVVDLPANPVGFFEVLKSVCMGPNCPLNDGEESIEKAGKPMEELTPENYNEDEIYRGLIKQGYREDEAKVIMYEILRNVNNTVYDKEHERDEVYHTFLSLGYTEEAAMERSKSVLDGINIKKSIDYKEINSEMQDYIEKLELKIQDMRFIYDNMTEEPVEIEKAESDGRPSKSWMDNCLSTMRHVKDVDDPGALCGWLWYHGEDAGFAAQRKGVGKSETVEIDLSELI